MDAPEVIATDLDGTLLDDEGRLSERNQKALLAARERGIRVVAVTARAPRGVYRHRELASSIDAAICCNGAIEYDFRTRTARFKHPIPLATARELQRRFIEVMPQALFSIETGEAQIAQSRRFQEGVLLHDPWTFVDPLEDLFAGVRAVAVVLVRSPDADGAALVACARMIDPPGVRLWHWGSHPSIEFSAAGATKGDALAAWCAERGIGAESVAAFGDMPTDAPMLAWAGRSYAVAGAHSEAVAAASHKTGANTDDGVAQAIEEILDGSP
ncbi:Cof-type HAD-IIB family hydrolase [Glycomyces sp. L485]|uniref:HAD family hydrolase n=1 Tax=Glycomyces sp. L485 TaxID=2909235 RepID=UPI001F4A5370|nr:Cof-type HAD-IIB family hydrolase [Glycomyces sp. L485]